MFIIVLVLNVLTVMIIVIIFVVFQGCGVGLGPAQKASRLKYFFGEIRQCMFGLCIAYLTKPRYTNPQGFPLIGLFSLQS